MPRIPLIDPTTMRPAVASPPPRSLIVAPTVKRRLEAPKAERLGDPISSDIVHSCMTCQRNVVCHDPDKDYRYRCTRWEELAALDHDWMNGGESTVDAIIRSGPVPVKSLNFDEVLARIQDREQENNLSELLEAALSTGFDVPPDLRIDDRDMPTPANYFEWVRNKGMSGMKGDLFPMQHKILVEYQGEYCPRCTDMRFLNTMHVNSSVAEFEDRVALLRHGVCPFCHVTKSELVCNGELNEYYTMNGVAGQRGGKCISGDSIVLTNTGPRRIGDIASTQLFRRGFTPACLQMVQPDGTLESTSHFYVEKNTYLNKVTLWNGMSISATAAHPLMTLRGWVKTSKLIQSDSVPLHVGQNAWASKTPSLAGLAQAAKEKFESFVISTPARNRAQVKRPATYYTGKLTPEIARLLGYYTAEGRGDRFTLTCHDTNVLDEVESTFQTLFGFECKRSGVDITDSTRQVGYYLDEIFDGLFFGGYSAVKRIPSLILSSPKNLVREYLRALFEGDGGVEGLRFVSYCSLSEGLVKEVSALLNNFGIFTQLRSKWAFATNGSTDQIPVRAYIVSVSGPQALQKFAQEVGFCSERKTNELQAAIALQANRTVNAAHWYDKYPEALKQNFLQCADRVWEELRLVPNPKAKGKWLGRQSVFNRNHEFHRIKASNVALTRRRIKSFVEGLQPFQQHLSVEVNQEIADWLALAENENLAYTYVWKVEKELTKRASYDVSIPSTHTFMANGLINHNTAVVNVNEGYNTARWLKLPNPQRVFNTLDQQLLVASYCALTFNQVRTNLWDPLVQSIRTSPWFKSYHSLLAHYGDKYGEELFKFEETIIRYRHRGLMMVPTGPNKRTMRGATRYSAVIDELGWFPFGDDNKEKEKMSADEVFESMENSMGTLQNKHEELLRQGHSNLPKPLMSNISSPSQVNDLIMKRHRDSIGSTTSYTFKLPTWEMNPQWPRDCGFLKRKFEQNESDAMRDFGCEPPMSSAAWITNIENAVGVFEGRSNNVKTRQYRMTSASGARQTSAMVDIKTRSNGGRVLLIDAGYVNNSFAFCVARLENGIPVIESLGEIVPDYKAPILFPQVYDDTLSVLTGECGVQFVCSDRWESIHTLQRLEQDFHVIPNNKYRCTYADFSAFRERIYDQSIILPKLEMDPDEIIRQHGDAYPTIFLRKPAAHLLYQMFTVRDFPGKTVEKGIGSTDDLFRTVVLAVKALTDPDIVPFLDENPDNRTQRVHGAVSSFGGSVGNHRNSVGVVGVRAQLGGVSSGAGGSSRMGVTSSRR